MSSLSDRMKGYEKVTSYVLPQRTYTIIRVDGKNFSKYTKRFEKPFDTMLSNVMDIATAETAKMLNPKFAYTQSDEASFLVTDFENIESQQMLGGKIQKLASIVAAKFTAEFNKAMLQALSTQIDNDRDFIAMLQDDRVPEINAVFDARVFTIADYREVSNYFIWRQQDATRNSVSMAASAVYSHKELNGKSNSDKQDMLMEKGINWNDYDIKFKRGIVIMKKSYMKTTDTPKGPVTTPRSKWTFDYNTPIFTKDREYLYNLIPVIGEVVEEE